MSEWVVFRDSKAFIMLGPGDIIRAVRKSDWWQLWDAKRGVWRDIYPGEIYSKPIEILYFDEE
jgi:hypothetical protein